MISDNLDKILDLYYLRYDIEVENNNLNKKARNYDSQLKKYIRNRDSQIGTFLEDGKILLNLEAEEDLSCENIKVKSGCFQYYYLEKQQLLAYIGFRTKLRKSELPKNPQLIFLNIYLMEVVNDFYSFSFSQKISKIKEIEKIFSSFKKFNKIFNEAFQVLYFQCVPSLTIIEYEKIFNIDNLFKDFSEEKSVFNKYDYFLEKTRNNILLNKIDDYLISQSFEYILKKALEKDFKIYINDKELSLSKQINSEDFQKYSKAINRIYSLYPITTNKILYSKDGKQIIVQNGILRYSNKFIFDQEIIIKIIEFSRNSFRKLLKGSYEENKEDEKLLNSYFLRNRYSLNNKEFIIFDIVKDWVEKNEYCKDAYQKSLDYILFNKAKLEFNIDSKEIASIREKSAKIQDKLIIEDEIISDSQNRNKFEKKINVNNNEFNYFEKLRNKEKTVIIEPKEKSSDNIFDKFIKTLSKEEEQILKYFIDNNYEKAVSVSKKENIMLSLLLDQINLKATEIIEDILIDEDHIIEDYKEAIIKSFKKKGTNSE
ncbi:MAG: hypothetical protein EOL97_12300 [Spirochaetia bacterium]|nr:hypothetical protein [Spirochaetia bacterium]